MAAQEEEGGGEGSTQPPQCPLPVCPYCGIISRNVPPAHSMASSSQVTSRNEKDGHTSGGSFSAAVQVTDQHDWQRQVRMKKKTDEVNELKQSLLILFHDAKECGPTTRTTVFTAPKPIAGLDSRPPHKRSTLRELSEAAASLCRYCKKQIGKATPRCLKGTGEEPVVESPAEIPRDEDWTFHSWPNKAVPLTEKQIERRAQKKAEEVENEHAPFPRAPGIEQDLSDDDDDDGDIHDEEMLLVEPSRDVRLENADLVCKPANRKEKVTGALTKDPRRVLEKLNEARRKDEQKKMKERKKMENKRLDEAKRKADKEAKEKAMQARAERVRKRREKADAANKPVKEEPSSDAEMDQGGDLSDPPIHSSLPMEEKEASERGAIEKAAEDENSMEDLPGTGPILADGPSTSSKATPAELLMMTNGLVAPNAERSGGAKMSQEKKLSKEELARLALEMFSDLSEEKVEMYWLLIKEINSKENLDDVLKAARELKKEEDEEETGRVRENSSLNKGPLDDECDEKEKDAPSATRQPSCPQSKSAHQLARRNTPSYVMSHADSMEQPIEEDERMQPHKTPVKSEHRPVQQQRRAADDSVESLLSLMTITPADETRRVLPTLSVQALHQFSVTSASDAEPLQGDDSVQDKSEDTKESLSQSRAAQAKSARPDKVPTEQGSSNGVVKCVDTRIRKEAIVDTEQPADPYTPPKDPDAYSEEVSDIVRSPTPDQQQVLAEWFKQRKQTLWKRIAEGIREVRAAVLRVEARMKEGDEADFADVLKAGIFVTDRMEHGPAGEELMFERKTSMARDMRLKYYLERCYIDVERAYVEEQLEKGVSPTEDELDDMRIEWHDKTFVSERYEQLEQECLSQESQWDDRFRDSIQRIIDRERSELESAEQALRDQCPWTSNSASAEERRRGRKNAVEVRAEEWQALRVLLSDHINHEEQCLLKAGVILRKKEHIFQRMMLIGIEWLQTHRFKFTKAPWKELSKRHIAPRTQADVISDSWTELTEDELKEREEEILTPFAKKYQEECDRGIARAREQADNILAHAHVNDSESEEESNADDDDSPQPPPSGEASSAAAAGELSYGTRKQKLWKRLARKVKGERVDLLAEEKRMKRGNPSKEDEDSMCKRKKEHAHGLRAIYRVERAYIQYERAQKENQDSVPRKAALDRLREEWYNQRPIPDPLTLSPPSETPPQLRWKGFFRDGAQESIDREKSELEAAEALLQEKCPWMSSSAGAQHRRRWRKNAFDDRAEELKALINLFIEFMDYAEERLSNEGDLQREDDFTRYKRRLRKWKRIHYFSCTRIPWDDLPSLQVTSLIDSITIPERWQELTDDEQKRIEEEILAHWVKQLQEKREVEAREDSPQPPPSSGTSDTEVAQGNSPAAVADRRTDGGDERRTKEQRQGDGANDCNGNSASHQSISHRGESHRDDDVSRLSDPQQQPRLHQPCATIQPADASDECPEHAVIGLDDAEESPIGQQDEQMGLENEEEEEEEEFAIEDQRENEEGALETPENEHEQPSEVKGGMMEEYQESEESEVEEEKEEKEEEEKEQTDQSDGSSDEDDGGSPPAGGSSSSARHNSHELFGATREGRGDNGDGSGRRDERRGNDTDNNEEEILNDGEVDEVIEEPSLPDLNLSNPSTTSIPTNMAADEVHVQADECHDDDGGDATKTIVKMHLVEGTGMVMPGTRIDGESMEAYFARVKDQLPSLYARWFPANVPSMSDEEREVADPPEDEDEREEHEEDAIEEEEHVNKMGDDEELVEEEMEPSEEDLLIETEERDNDQGFPQTEEETPIADEDQLEDEEEKAEEEEEKMDHQDATETEATDQNDSPDGPETPRGRKRSAKIERQLEFGVQREDSPMLKEREKIWDEYLDERVFKLLKDIADKFEESRQALLEEEDRMKEGNPTEEEEESMMKRKKEQLRDLRRRYLEESAYLKYERAHEEDRVKRGFLLPHDSDLWARLTRMREEWYNCPPPITDKLYSSPPGWEEWDEAINDSIRDDWRRFKASERLLRHHCPWIGNCSLSLQRQRRRRRAARDNLEEINTLNKIFIQYMDDWKKEVKRSFLDIKTQFDWWTRFHFFTTTDLPWELALLQRRPVPISRTSHWREWTEEERVQREQEVLLTIVADKVEEGFTAKEFEATDDEDEEELEEEADGEEEHHDEEENGEEAERESKQEGNDQEYPHEEEDENEMDNDDEEEEPDTYDGISDGDNSDPRPPSSGGEAALPQGFTPVLAQQQNRTRVRFAEVPTTIFVEKYTIEDTEFGEHVEDRLEREEDQSELKEEENDEEREIEDLRDDVKDNDEGKVRGHSVSCISSIG